MRPSRRTSIYPTNGKSGRTLFCIASIVFVFSCANLEDTTDYNNDVSSCNVKQFSSFSFIGESHNEAMTMLFDHFKGYNWDEYTGEEYVNIIANYEAEMITDMQCLPPECKKPSYMSISRYKDCLTL